MGFKLNVERRAAWELYVELNTRVTVQPLGPNDGLLREALTSLYSMFDVTRTVLKKAGPGVAQGQDSLGSFAMQILNDVLRPLLAEWHPALTHWESQKDAALSQLEHERAWPKAKKLRGELKRTQRTLSGYCTALAILAGVDPPKSRS